MMGVVTQKYVDDLPPIYRDILAVFPDAEPARKAGWGLAYQTLASRLSDKYSLGEIMQACEKMDHGGAVEIKNRMFVHPTDLGEEIVALLTGKRAGQVSVPEFPSPTQA
jgi:hypothetical protein